MAEFNPGDRVRDMRTGGVVIGTVEDLGDVPGTVWVEWHHAPMVTDVHVEDLELIPRPEPTVCTHAGYPDWCDVSCEDTSAPEPTNAAGNPDIQGYLDTPTTDLVGTVRVHPDDDPEDPNARRVMRVDAVDGDWFVLTDNDKGILVGVQEIVLWPRQSLTDVARVLGHFDSTDLRGWTKATELTAKLVEVQRERDEEKRRTEGFRDLARDYRDRAEKAESSSARMRQIIADTDQTNRDLNTVAARAEKAERERDDLSADYEQMEADRDDWKSIAHEEINRAEKAEREGIETNDCANRYYQRASEAEDYQHAMKVAERDARHLRTELETLNKAYDELNEVLEDERSFNKYRVDELNTELEARCWDNDNLRWENEDLARDIRDLDQELNDMARIVEETAALREQSDSEVRSADDEIRQWVDRATKAEADRDQYKNLCVQLQKNHNEAIDSLENEVIDLREALEGEQQSAKCMTDEFDALERKNDELKKALRTLSQ